MKLIRTLLAATMLTAAAPALAQSPSEMSLRINRLEQQVRQLTGQNEEYQHQIRQLQQQLQSQGGAPAGMPSAATTPRQPNAGPPNAGPPGTIRPPNAGPPAGTRPNPGPQIGSADPSIPAPGPRDLGTMPSGPTTGPVTGSPGPLNSSEPGAPLVIAPDFQQPGQGAPPGVDVGPGMPATGPGPSQGAPQTATATGSAEEEYALGAGFLQRKDYEFAETQFRSFLNQFPTDPRVPDALYGLGESFYQRKQHSDAIEPFLDVVTKHAQSPRAADSMLRLGQTLGAIDQKEQACATLMELGNKYPRSNARAQSTKEMSRLGC
jgi:tol-pal system protein YbgF